MPDTNAQHFESPEATLFYALVATEKMRQSACPNELERLLRLHNYRVIAGRAADKVRQEEGVEDT